MYRTVRPIPIDNSKKESCSWFQNKMCTFCTVIERQYRNSKSHRTIVLNIRTYVSLSTYYVRKSFFFVRSNVVKINKKSLQEHFQNMWIVYSNRDRKNRYNHVYISKFDFFFKKKSHPTNKYLNWPGNHRFWHRDNGAPYFETHIISKLKTII